MNSANLRESNELMKHEFEFSFNSTLQIELIRQISFETVNSNLTTYSYFAKHTS